MLYVDHAEVTSWLTYWVTFAALTLFEGARLWSSSRNPGASIKLMSWLPFYYVMRPRIPSENEAFGEEFGSKSCFFDAFPMVFGGVSARFQAGAHRVALPAGHARRAGALFLGSGAAAATLPGAGGRHLVEAFSFEDR